MQEHSGNDPSTQLVPPAVAGGWNREPGSDTSTAATASAPAPSHNAAALSAGALAVAHRDCVLYAC